MSEKEKFTIEEVCNIVGLPPHIIRYWQTEFPLLIPKRDELRRRIYSPRDVDIIVRIRHLLYESKYTIAATKAEVTREFR